MNTMRLISPVLACLCVSTMLLLGCNKNDAAPTPSSGVTNTTPGTALPSTGSQQQQPTTTSSPEAGKWQVRTDADGRKWFGKVPYDVFFDDPLGIANDNEAVAVMPAESAAVPEGKPTTTAEPPTADTGSSSQWNDLISAEALDAEVKRIRNFLNPKLQSVGQYNSNLAMIPQQAATLAVLADVASRHNGDISWKADALYIRDLAGAMNAKPLQRGATFQRELLSLYEQISDTLNRSRPSDLAEPDADAAIADTADMGFLMKRIEQAYNEMKTNAGSEAGFRDSLEMIKREAALLAVLGKVISGGGYGYNDDEEFGAYAKTLSSNAMKMFEATATETFAEYDAALSAAYQACNQCHMDYN
ncbi:MAG: hypothetical protein AB8G99_04220 [Planctomycetaceae bacterium]